MSGLPEARLSFASASWKSLGLNFSGKMSRMVLTLGTREDGISRNLHVNNGIIDGGAVMRMTVKHHPLHVSRAYKIFLLCPDLFLPPCQLCADCE